VSCYSVVVPRERVHVVELCPNKVAYRWIERVSVVQTPAPQGPPGPPGPSGNLVFRFQVINAESFPIRAGQPVQMDSSGMATLAQANAWARHAVGLACETVGPGSLLEVARIGILELSDWSAAVGSPNLTTNSEYFLAVGVAGILITAPPNFAPDVCQYLAVSVSPTKLYVDVQRPIQL